jgi:hypothetical protein
MLFRDPVGDDTMIGYDSQSLLVPLSRMLTTMEHMRKNGGNDKVAVGKNSIAGTAETRSRKIELVLLICFCCIVYDL